MLHVQRCYSQGASLGSMVAFMTYGNRKFADLDLRMRKLIPILHKAMKKLMSYVDQDATAFSDYMVSHAHVYFLYRLLRYVCLCIDIPFWFSSQIPFMFFNFS